MQQRSLPQSLDQRMGLRVRGMSRRSLVLPLVAPLLAFLCLSGHAAALRSFSTAAAPHSTAREEHHGWASWLRRHLLSDIGVAGQCPVPKIDMTKDKYACVVWRKVCLDQNVIVSYDPDVHPTTSMGTLPTLNVTEIMYNIPSKFGIGDRYRKGSALRFPPLYVRPSNDMEEEEELQKPTFSSCTTPLLLYAHYPYNAAETYRYIFEKLVNLQQDGFFDRRFTLVPGVPPGTRVPSYTKFWYGALTDREVISLSQLSSRIGSSAPSNATWEGRHIRCFEKVVGCRIRYDGYGLKFYNAGQYVVRHYMPQYLAQSAAFEERLVEKQGVRIPDDPSVFKVVFISRTPHQSAVGRTILNEKELVEQCNNAAPGDLPPPEWGVPYKKYLCLAHIFGENQLMDVWLMRRVDALIGMHGAGLTNSLFMKRGGSVVEVRPLGFSGRESWANRYARFKTSSLREKPWPVFWYGIDTFNASLSEPGIFEKEDKPHFSKFRAIKARDRHVRVTWPSFRHQLLNMVAVARTHDRYMELRLSGAYYVTDDVQPAEQPGNDPHVDKTRQRLFADPDQERAALLPIPLAEQALKDAATPDQLPADGGAGAAMGAP